MSKQPPRKQQQASKQLREDCAGKVVAVAVAVDQPRIVEHSRTIGRAMLGETGVSKLLVLLRSRAAVGLAAVALAAGTWALMSTLLTPVEELRWDARVLLVVALPLVSLGTYSLCNITIAARTLRSAKGVFVLTNLAIVVVGTAYMRASAQSTFVLLLATPSHLGLVMFDSLPRRVRRRSTISFSPLWVSLFAVLLHGIATQRIHAPRPDISLGDEKLSIADRVMAALANLMAFQLFSIWMAIKQPRKLLCAASAVGLCLVDASKVDLLSTAKSGFETALMATPHGKDKVRLFLPRYRVHRIAVERSLGRKLLPSATCDVLEAIEHSRARAIVLEGAWLAAKVAMLVCAQPAFINGGSLAGWIAAIAPLPWVVAKTCALQLDLLGRVLRTFDAWYCAANIVLLYSCLACMVPETSQQLAFAVAGATGLAQLLGETRMSEHGAVRRFRALFALFEYLVLLWALASHWFRLADRSFDVVGLAFSLRRVGISASLNLVFMYGRLAWNALLRKHNFVLLRASIEEQSMPRRDAERIVMGRDALLRKTGLVSNMPSRRLSHRKFSGVVAPAKRTKSKSSLLSTSSRSGRVKSSISSSINSSNKSSLASAKSISESLSESSRGRRAKASSMSVHSVGELSTGEHSIGESISESPREPSFHSTFASGAM